MGGQWRFILCVHLPTAASDLRKMGSIGLELVLGLLICYVRTWKKSVSNCWANSPLVLIFTSIKFGIFNLLPLISRINILIYHAIGNWDIPKDKLFRNPFQALYVERNPHRNMNKTCTDTPLYPHQPRILCKFIPAVVDHALCIYIVSIQNRRLGKTTTSWHNFTVSLVLRS